MLEALLYNPYEKVVSSILPSTWIIRRTADATGRIESVTPDCLVAHPGDTVKLTVKIRRYDQQMETRRLAVTVPEHYARTMMAIGVIGGAEVGLSRQVMLAMPTRAEGEKGLVRLLSGDLSGRRLVVASFQPAPSYQMDGGQLLDLPAPTQRPVAALRPGGIISSFRCRTTGRRLCRQLYPQPEYRVSALAPDGAGHHAG